MFGAGRARPPKMPSYAGPVGAAAKAAANIGSVGVNAEHFVQVVNGFTSVLVLVRTAHFETVLDVHIDVDCTSCCKSASLKELRVTLLREFTAL